MLETPPELLPPLPPVGALSPPAAAPRPKELLEVEEVLVAVAEKSVGNVTSLVKLAYSLVILRN